MSSISVSACTKTGPSTSNPVTSSFACVGSTAATILMIVVAGGVARTGGNPTYNGVDLTQIESATKHSSSPETTVEMWYIINPGSGAYTVSVPNAGGVTLSYMMVNLDCYDYSGVELVHSDSFTGVTTTPWANNYAGHQLMDVRIAMVGAGFDSFSSNGNASPIYKTDAGSYGFGAQYLEKTWPITNMATYWSNSSSDDWAVITATFRKSTRYNVLQVPKVAGYAVLVESPPVTAKPPVCFIIT